MTGALRIEPAPALDDLAPAWSALAERAGSVFATPEWVREWLRAYPGAGALDLRVARDGRGDLVAVVALVRRPGRPRLVRFAGHGPADELGPVCAPGDRAAVLRALGQSLRSERNWDVLLAEELPGDVDAAGALGGVVLRRDASPEMHLGDGGWDAYLRSRSRNFREQVRRRERRLLRDHDAAFRLATDAGRLAADLDALIDLHERRWEEASTAFAGPRRALHHAFARRALEAGWLRLWLLEVEQRPVAAWLGYRFAGTESFYQSGRDPEWEPYSVGSVLLHHTMRSAADDGIATYRLLRGGEEYKARYATADPGLQTVAVAGSLPGRAAVAGVRAALRLPPEARRRVLGPLQG